MGVVIAAVVETAAAVAREIILNFLITRVMSEEIVLSYSGLQ